MKTQKFLAVLCIGMLFGIILFLIAIQLPDNLGWLMIVIYVLLLFPTCMLIIYIGRTIGRQLDERDKENQIRGAKKFLDQLTEDDRFRQVVNQDVPLINAKGEEYGTESTYGYLRDFVDRKFKVD